MADTRIIASPQTWIEGEAVRQLDATAAWPGMRACVGMPDLHPAKGSPNGAAFLADRIYPSLVGSDNGCGVGFWMTDIVAQKAKVDRIITRLDGLDTPWDGDPTEWLAEAGVARTEHDVTLGTPGHGNHFIEVQQIVDVVDAVQFDRLGLDITRLYLTVHSGSRGFGEAVLRRITERFGATGIMADSPEGQEYLVSNAHARAWARANRALCAHRTMEALRTEGRRILDICHNSVTGDGCGCWLHRKGAAPADQGPVVIPGSRNDLSFLVQPIAEREDALRSIAHGAGRKISRSEAYGKLAKLYRNQDIQQNQWGGRVICGERSLLWEEARECYKDIGTVIADLVQAGLIEVIASLRPWVTFKTSEGAREVQQRDRKAWQRERSAARDVKRRR